MNHFPNLPPLLTPQEMPSLEGLSTPAQFYLVTRQPAPLAGMPYPAENTPWNDLYALGLRHVVSLHSRPGKPYDPSPLQILSSVHLQDLYGGMLPDDPLWESNLLGVVVKVAREALEIGEGVLVHCAGGIGRTGTVIGCLLSSLGWPPQTVIDYLDQLNRARCYCVWPESPWQAEMVQKYANAA